MALVSTGLTDSGAGPGITTHVHVQYDDTLADLDGVIWNANALLAAVETEYTALTAIYATPAYAFGPANRQLVNVVSLSPSYGALEYGYGGRIEINANVLLDALNPIAADWVTALFVYEFAEILLTFTNSPFNTSVSEAFSQYFAHLRRPLAAAANTVYWVNTFPREDWITRTHSGETHTESWSCGANFLYYLTIQLGFTIADVLVGGASTFAGIYKNLTGDLQNPYPTFANLVEFAYSSDLLQRTFATVEGTFPIAVVSIWLNRSIYRQSVAVEVIATDDGVWPRAFSVLIEGFSKRGYEALGSTVLISGTLSALTGVTITPSGPAEYADPSNEWTPQRIRLPFDVTTTSDALTAFPSSGTTVYGITATLMVGDDAVPGAVASTSVGFASASAGPTAVLADDFEAYDDQVPRFGGTLDDWSVYQAWAQVGVGRGGSKAGKSFQGALGHYNLNPATATPSGRVVAWAYRFSLAEIAAFEEESLFYHGVGLNVTPTQANEPQSQATFGFMNDTQFQFGPGDVNDLVFWNRWRNSGGGTSLNIIRVANVYVDSQWQKFDLSWTLSTVAADGIYLNPDGAVRVLVDDVVVVDATGLYLTVMDNTGPSVENTWDGVTFSWGGYLDDIMIWQVGATESAPTPDRRLLPILGAG